MKLSYYDDFAFAVQTKNGIFALNPTEKNEKILFSIFTGKDRDISLKDKFLSWPGEYEFGGIAIQLFETGDGELAVKVVAEEVRMVFLPALPLEFTEKEKEVIGTVDILMPYIQDTASWKKLVEEIDPKVILPVGPQSEKFLLEMGANVPETQEFTFDTDSLPADQTTFVKIAVS